MHTRCGKIKYMSALVYHSAIHAVKWNTMNLPCTCEWRRPSVHISDITKYSISYTATSVQPSVESPPKQHNSAVTKKLPSLEMIYSYILEYCCSRVRVPLLIFVCRYNIIQKGISRLLHNNNGVIDWYSCRWTRLFLEGTLFPRHACTPWGETTAVV